MKHNKNNILMDYKRLISNHIIVNISHFMSINIFLKEKCEKKRNNRKKIREIKINGIYLNQIKIFSTLCKSK